MGWGCSEWMQNTLTQCERYVSATDTRTIGNTARLAQSVERQPFKLVVVGSSPTVGIFLVDPRLEYHQYSLVYDIVFRNRRGCIAQR